jgi:hypothetical protein
MHGSLAKSPPPGAQAPESLVHIRCFVDERIVSNDNVVQWADRRGYSKRRSIRRQIPSRPASASLLQHTPAYP